MNQPIQDAIALAEKLRRQYVFLTSQLFPVRQPGCGGITGDRFLRLYYDEEVITSWQPEWAASRVLVTVEHYVRRHFSRQNGRNPVCWDTATEISITDSLMLERLPFPPGTLSPETFKLPSGLTAEEYYIRLFRMCTRRGQEIDKELAEEAGVPIPVFGSAGSEELKDWEIPEDADVPTIDAMVAMMRMRDFQAQSSKPGAAPGSEVREVESEREGAVDWRVELAGIHSSTLSTQPGTVDWSFLAPDPDMALHPGIIFPGMIGSSSVTAVIIDSSGSMGRDRIAQAYAETVAIMRRNEGIVLLFSVDSAVHIAREIVNEHQLAIVGGGGTDMGIGIRAAANHSPRPDVIVVITDNDTVWPKRNPAKVPIIIVNVGHGLPPRWAHKVINVPV